MRKMSLLKASVLRLKAIVPPSGEYAGVKLVRHGWRLRVSCLSFLSATPMVKRSGQDGADQFHW
jgi:hypothetical protein